MSTLIFQFWNDARFQDYGPQEQALLQANVAVNPRPEVLELQGGRCMFNFDQMDIGGTVQVNMRTGFERVVRIKPPFCLSGASRPPALPCGAKFQYFDGRWRDYDPAAQSEIRTYAACAPLPKKVQFLTHSNLYWLMDLDELYKGGTTFQQVNVHTGTERRVRIVPSIGGAASCSLGAADARAHVDFSTQSAEFWIRPSARDGMQACHESAQEVLRSAWEQVKRPTSVRLPSGDVVERFQDLEAGGAGVKHSSGAWMPIELRIPTPRPDAISLPEELDLELDLKPESYGCFLNREELACFDGSCAICTDEIGQAKVVAQKNTNAPVLSNDTSDTGEASAITLRCGHVYHAPCLEEWFRTKQRCPECQMDFGKVVGKQPRIGSMSWRFEPFKLAGHPQAQKTVVIEFDFPPGIDTDGVHYDERSERCFLPGNAQGFVLLELFKIAFRRCVMFGLGNSMTFATYRPTFNVHVKTSVRGGVAGHGFPDAEYFHRCLEELRANGVTVADLGRPEIDDADL